MDSELLARFIIAAVVVLFAAERLEYHDTLAFVFRTSRAWEALRMTAIAATLVMCVDLVVTGG
jgi:hypothetical protein